MEKQCINCGKEITWSAKNEAGEDCENGVIHFDENKPPKFKAHYHCDECKWKNCG